MAKKLAVGWGRQRRHVVATKGKVVGEDRSGGRIQSHGGVCCEGYCACGGEDVVMCWFLNPKLQNLDRMFWTFCEFFCTIVGFPYSSIHVECLVWNRVSFLTKFLMVESSIEIENRFRNKKQNKNFVIIFVCSERVSLDLSKYLEKHCVQNALKTEFLHYLSVFNYESAVLLNLSLKKFWNRLWHRYLALIAPLPKTQTKLSVNGTANYD